LTKQKVTRRTAAAVWVPNRNGLFINVAATLCDARGWDTIVVGFNAEEAQTFPDNSAAFVQAINRALRYSTANQVRVQAPTAHLTKRQIVRLARRWKVPLDLCWPCYRGGTRLCRTCESCQRFFRAMDSP
jgi:7-cyano-7-deazaguanine synthase